MRRIETLSPTVHLLVAGAITGDTTYASWRAGGTTDWLLLNTLAGHGRIGAANEAFLPVATGDLVLIRPGSRHDYGTAPGRPRWDLQFAHFRPRPDWLGLLDWPEVGPGVRCVNTAGEAHRRVTEALGRAVTMSRSGLTRGELFGVNALETALLWVDTFRPDPGHLDPRLVTVLEGISLRLAEPLSTTTLAKMAGLSVSRLTHLFVAQLGISPMRFVEQQRMRAAQQLLELASTPVAAVARAVGYGDPLYFSARFKRFSGHAPTAYRSRRAPSREGRGGERRARQPVGD